MAGGPLHRQDCLPLPASNAPYWPLTLTGLVPLTDPNWPGTLNCLILQVDLITEHSKWVLQADPEAGLQVGALGGGGGLLVCVCVHVCMCVYVCECACMYVCMCACALVAPACPPRMRMFVCVCVGRG